VKRQMMRYLVSEVCAEGGGENRRTLHLVLSK
jgi:hypothetical protein